MEPLICIPLDKYNDSQNICGRIFNQNYSNSFILENPDSDFRWGSSISNTILKQFPYKDVDADFIYLNDKSSINHFLIGQTNSFNYFKLLLKFYCLNDFYKNKKETVLLDTKKNRSFLEFSFFEKFTSILKADIVWVTSNEMFEDILFFLKNNFSKRITENFQNKSIITPPFCVYRFLKFDPFIYNEKKYNDIVFIWNNRVTAEKRFNLFLETVQLFQLNYPNINSYVYITCDKKDLNNHNQVIIDKLKNVNLTGFISNKEEYEKLVKKSNCHIVTTNRDSFYSSLYDSISKDNVIFSYSDTNIYTPIFGNRYACNTIEEMVNKIYETFRSKDRIVENIIYHKNIVKNLPKIEDSVKIITNKLQMVLEKHVNSLGIMNESVGINKLLKLIENKKIVTKRDLYKELEFTIGINDFWLIYYYKIRKLGVKVKYFNGKTYYFLDDFDFNEKRNQIISSQIDSNLFEE